MENAKSASGQWNVKEGREDEFVDRWTRWIAWTSENIPGFRSATLLRAQDDSSLFTSVSHWEDDPSLKAWKASPGFRDKIESVKELCDEFAAANYDVAVIIGAPALRS